MAIELSITDEPARVLKVGDENFTLAAGKVLKVETNPDGEELLTVEVPPGTQWDVVVYVSIVETTA